MKNLWNFNKFNFIKTNLLESEFNQYQLGIDVQNPLGPGYGFASDPGLSIYGTDQDSPYVDYYSRTGGSINRLNAISKAAMGTDAISQSKSDMFLDDFDYYSNYKILRIVKNDSLHLNIFISFHFDDEEFFGVFKNFNGYSQPKFDSEMFNDQRFNYIDKKYKLKLNSYLKKILDNWFIPKKKLYKNLKDNCQVKDDMGSIKYLKKNSVIEIKGVDMEKDGTPYIIMKQNDKKYYLKNTDYFFFNYWFESIVN